MLYDIGGIDWANAENVPPLNEPVCGFRGDKGPCSTHSKFSVSSDNEGLCFVALELHSASLFRASQNFLRAIFSPGDYMKVVVPATTAVILCITLVTAAGLWRFRWEKPRQYFSRLQTLIVNFFCQKAIGKCKCLVESKLWRVFTGKTFWRSSEDNTQEFVCFPRHNKSKQVFLFSCCFMLDDASVVSQSCKKQRTLPQWSSNKIILFDWQGFVRSGSIQAWARVVHQSMSAGKSSKNAFIRKSPACDLSSAPKGQPPGRWKRPGHLS